MSVLKDTKVGDELLRRDGYGGLTSVTVDRVTATRVMAGKEAFGRRSGKRVGDGDWARCSVEPMTPVARERWQTKQRTIEMTKRINEASAGLRRVIVGERNVERVEAFLRVAAS